MGTQWRLLVVIDDIERCSGSKALDVLETASILLDHEGQTDFVRHRSGRSTTPTCRSCGHRRRGP